MMVMDSHKAVGVEDAVVTLDYFVKQYVKYLSIFNCVEIDADDRKLKIIVEYLDEYIRELIGGQNE